MKLDEKPPTRRQKKRKPGRDELLQWLIDDEVNPAYGTMLHDARNQFHEIIKKSTSSSAVEWLFNQLIGTPRTTVIQTIDDDKLLTAASRVTARFLPPELFEQWWQDLRYELGEAPV